jgi:hypothetical protein
MNSARLTPTFWSSGRYACPISERKDLTLQQVHIDLSDVIALERSLKRLELKDGIQGVKRLRPHWQILEFTDSPDHHLHIVVE